MDDSNNVLGVVTEGNLTARLVGNRVKPSDECTCAMYKQFRRVSLHTTLSELAHHFDKESYVLVMSDQHCYSSDGEHTVLSVVSGVATRIDLLNCKYNDNVLLTHCAAAAYTLGLTSVFSMTDITSNDPQNVSANDNA